MVVECLYPTRQDFNDARLVVNRAVTYTCKDIPGLHSWRQICFRLHPERFFRNDGVHLNFIGMRKYIKEVRRAALFGARSLVPTISVSDLAGNKRLFSEPTHPVTIRPLKPGDVIMCHFMEHPIIGLCGILNWIIVCLIVQMQLYLPQKVRKSQGGINRARKQPER